MLSNAQMNANCQAGTRLWKEGSGMGGRGT
jgi:hypothetical protein